jgi:hypothetical protein
LKDVATLSQNGVVRVWDAVSGALHFESSQYQASSGRLNMDAKLRFQTSVLEASQGQVQSGDISFVNFEDGLYVASLFGSSSSISIFKVSNKGETASVIETPSPVQKFISDAGKDFVLGSDAVWGIDASKVRAWLVFFFFLIFWNRRPCSKSKIFLLFILM